jgi:hypothetical protein
MSGPGAPRWESRLLTAVFGVALALHFFCATYNLKVPFMPGHEFRQAQTAIISHYIDEQDNFSLLYETPILGKPWVSILMEVPFYEWAVVGLSRATGVPHIVAARTISLLSFYLSLPAFYLLLGRLGLARPRRLLALALVLTCPVYLFYSRAFLIDPLAFMCSAWFLLGFVRTMDTRRWSWLALTIVSGTLAALVKSAMLAVWLLPAAGYGAWLLGRDLRAGDGWRPPLRTLLWGLATVVVALGMLRWWVVYTDPLKARHASAWIFTSSNLSQGNWGLLDFRAIFSRDLWGYLRWCWGHAIMPPGLLGAGLLAGVFLAPPWRGRALGLAALFMLPQLLFPFAYAYQDYYFYSNAVFANVALACVIGGLLDSRAPRWVGALLLVVVAGAQLTTYWRGYRSEQVQVLPGGYPFMNTLRDLTPKKSVIVVAGADWAAMTPLYAGRKALMVRNGLEHDAAYLDRAFAELADEDVSALVLWGALRGNRGFIERAARAFDFDASTPTFVHPAADVYLRRVYIPGGQLHLRNSRQYPDVTIPAGAPVVAVDAPFAIPATVAHTAFAMITPAPQRARFVFGLDLTQEGKDTVLAAHPDSDLWLAAPAGATTIRWSFGFFPAASERGGSDGVEFTLTGETADGGRRELYRRLLDPAHQPKDRGRQTEVLPYAPRLGEVLQFSTRPNKNAAYDWVYWAGITVQ